jgi:hypothetical protein
MPDMTFSREVSRRRRAELARLLGALPPEEHEPVIAAFRAFAAAAGELPQAGAALGAQAASAGGITHRTVSGHTASMIFMRTR